MKIKSQLALLVLSGLLTTGRLYAETTPAQDAPQQTIEQRLAILERKYELAQEDAAVKSKDAPVLPKVSGYVQADYRDFVDDAGTFVDQFLIRRARLTIDGTLHKSTDYRFQVDFANNTTALLDAYAEFKARPYAKLRVGKFKSPISLERLQSDPVTIFSELSLVSNLVPNRDTGVQLGGDIAGGIVTYQIAAANGVVDGASGETDTNDGKDYSGRIFVSPGLGLGLGVAGSVGDQLGTASVSQLPSFRSYGQQAFFSYLTGAFADGNRTRFSAQGSWYAGSLGLLAERVNTRQRVTRTTTNTVLEHTAWETTLSYVLTGEPNSYKGVKPRKVFEPSKHQWGAFEIAGRVAGLKLDADTFPLYASATASAREASSWSAGINWYPSANVRVATSHENTSFNGGATSGDRRTEKVFLTRVQVSY